MMPATETQTSEARDLQPLIEDGVTYIVDAETGEVVETRVEGFRIDSAESAEWVLAKMQKVDADIAALAARERALVENIRSMRSRLDQKRKGLSFRFDGELAEFAKQNLEKGKKSWVCPYGKVAFRTSPKRLQVADPEKALAWATQFDPDSVKVTREFQISRLGVADGGMGWKDSLLAAKPEDLALRGFEVTPATETTCIETGI